MRVALISLLLLVGIAGPHAHAEGSRKDEPMVEIADVAPRIVIGLRYATRKNLTKRAIYPANARAFLRRGTAERLLVAQHWLDENAERGVRLKIWDAWRPEWAQRLLWHVLPNKEYLGDPSRGGSLHTWGNAVDATLVDARGEELRMPTDFDVISPKAKTYYAGSDRTVARNLRWLQQAMSKAGFLVVYDEWWHFVDREWKEYAKVDLPINQPLAKRP